jgi:Ca2+:H+ antiporter
VNGNPNLTAIDEDQTANSKSFEPSPQDGNGPTQRFVEKPDETQDTAASSQITDDPKAVEEEDDDPHKGETSWQSFHRRMFVEGQIPVGQQIKTVLFPHWYTINWLLICSPVGIGLHFVKGINPLAPFLVNFIAIIPLAGMLSNATEELALRVGEVLGGLLNASFGYVAIFSNYQIILISTEML